MSQPAPAEQPGAQPAAQEAVTDAAAAPRNEDAQAALRLQLRKLLAEDEERGAERCERFSHQPPMRLRRTTPR